MDALRLLLVITAPLWCFELKRGSPELPWLGAAPDPLLLLPLLVALRGSATAAAVAGAVAGLLLDLPGDAPFGAGAARLALIAWAVARARATVALDDPFARPLVVLAAALAFELSSAVVLEASTGGDAPLAALAAQGARVALATALVAPLAWPCAASLVREAVASRGR